MESFLPTQTWSLFLVFESCFTAPSFAYFRAYVWALMVVEGRKCMTRLARCAFFHQRDLSSWERFLAEHKPRQHIRYTSAELTRPYSAPGSGANATPSVRVRRAITAGREKAAGSGASSV